MVTAQRSYIMSRIKSKNTLGEQALHRALLLMDLEPERWGALFGKPDFVFPRQKVVVFMDGCFWHCCPLHFKLPKTRKAFWRKKFTANRLRDRLVTSTLERTGYVVIRLWECAVKKFPLTCAARVRRAVISA